jgi:hypothetical protein
MMNLPRLLFFTSPLLSHLFGPAQAHEVRPGYLELRQFDAETWDLLWKVPAKGDRRLALEVQLPENCRNGEPGTRFVNGAYIVRWRTRCSGGLTGQEVGDCRPARDAHGRTGAGEPGRRHRADGTPYTIGAHLYRQRRGKRVAGGRHVPRAWWRQ